jgi:hypothetical protein
MVCTIVRDDPVTDCRSKNIAIVIGSSGSNMVNGPSDLRIQAAKDFNAKLVTAAHAGSSVVPDRVAVVDLDPGPIVLYPMGDPVATGNTFDAINSDGGTYIGSSIATGIDEILNDESELFANRAGIIVLADDEGSSPDGQVLQGARARLRGTCVSCGFLSPLAATNSKPYPSNENYCK